MKNPLEFVIGSLDEKREWRQYKARVNALPTPYKTAAKSVERCLLYVGGISRGDILLEMSQDLADLFEQAAADSTPVRDIVGDDPVEFVETFLSNYEDGRWITKERQRLIDGITKAEKESE